MAWRIFFFFSLQCAVAALGWWLWGGWGAAVAAWVVGWGVGGIASLVDIYLVLCVVWALIVITGGNLTMLNDTVMSGSLYYKVFNVFNPFV